MILIRLKEEEVTRLSRIRDDVESELQELTASLFQEYLHYYLFIENLPLSLGANKTGIYPMVFNVFILKLFLLYVKLPFSLTLI